METKQTPNPISDYAAETIRHKARQLAGTAGFTKDDIEDIEQDLAVDLLERLPKFNPNRAKHTTFVARLIERKIANLIRYRTQECRDYRRMECSLSENLEDSEGEITERAVTISQDAVDIRMDHRVRSREDDTWLPPDVAAVIAGLPDDLRRVAEQLMAGSFARAVKALGMPRATLYGARDRLRAIFEDAGLRHYL